MRDMPETETSNSGTETLSDREFMVRLSQQVEDIGNELSAFHAGWLITSDTDRKRLDHLDVQVHEILQFIEEHRPALARATALLGKARTWKGWPGAVRQDGPQPLQVAVRPPVHSPAGPRLLRDTRMEAQAEEA